MVPGDCVRDRSGCARSWEVLGACALAACWLDEQAPAHTLLDDFEAVDRFCGIASAWELADERCRRLLAAALTGSFARRLVIVRGEERDKEALPRLSSSGSLEEPRFVGGRLLDLGSAAKRPAVPWPPAAPGVPSVATIEPSSRVHSPVVDPSRSHRLPSSAVASRGPINMCGHRPVC